MDLRLSLLFFCFTLQVKAQQWIPVTQSLWLPDVFYAAGAGITGESKLTGLARQQWQGMPGAPAFQWLQWQSASPWWTGGLAVGLVNQTSGLHRVTRADLTLNRRVLDRRELSCRIGGSLGIEQWMWDGSLMRTPEGHYEPGTIAHADPVLTDSRVLGLVPVMQLSAAIEVGRWQTWLGVQNLSYRQVKYETDRLAPTDLEAILRWQIVRTWAIRRWEVRVASGINTQINNLQAETGCFFEYNDNILWGISFRGYSPTSQDAFSLLLGWVPGKRTRVLYSFDRTTSGLRRVTDGSHELSVVYVLRQKARQPRLPNIMYNPRHL